MMKARHASAQTVDQFRRDARPPDERCRAIVVIPARNEEATLVGTLDALRLQTGCDGAPLPPCEFEVLLLLNNCTDRSVEVAEAYAEAYPGFPLHALTCQLEPEHAHAGTARRLLMEAAWARLQCLSGSAVRAILSTDADTHAAPNWVAQNLVELDLGADVVGGNIHLFARDLAALDAGTRAAYERDRLYQAYAARLESLLDPDPADPWARHRDHFGASLACRPEIYRRAGGLPAVNPLEDVAFVAALRNVGARIRHAPSVHVYTSARLEGRVQVGLSGQLRHWQQEAERGLPQMVESFEWLQHSFQVRASLRRFHAAEGQTADRFPRSWHDQLYLLRMEGLRTCEFLRRLRCDSLIEESFAARADTPRRYAEITQVIARLQAAVAALPSAPAHRV